MPTLTRKTAPAVDDPAADYADRYAEHLKRRDKARAEYEAARVELEEATIAELTGTVLAPGKLAGLESKVHSKERALAGLEAICDRSAGIQKRFVAGQEKATFEALAAERLANRATWRKLVTAQRVRLRDFEEDGRRIAALEYEDDINRDALRRLASRSGLDPFTRQSFVGGTAGSVQMLDECLEVAARQDLQGA